MTSGNISEEPIAYRDADANQRLESIADAFLTNNREIQTRIDDSVVRIFNDEMYPIRRARGYAPDPLSVSGKLPELLACGAELKNTFCLSRGRYIFLSHHIGDLENNETLKSFEEGIEYYQKIFRIKPGAIAVDLHPDYLSTKYGYLQANQLDLPILPVQHHHAHLAACLLDNNLTSNDPVIGLTYDGTGYGTDGKIWGGEILFGGYTSFERRYHLEEMPLPGGDAAIRNPSRIALSYLFSSGLEWDPSLPAVQAIPENERELIQAQLTHKINTPLTSSMGRLFDAVSALIGVRQIATYEGQAAIELENICDPVESNSYDMVIEKNTIKTSILLSQIISDLNNKIPQPTISAKFHNSIVRVSLECARYIQKETGCNYVALSGGVWQNMTLLGKMTAQLNQNGLKYLVHRQVPANDGGVSAGQLMILAKYLENN
jgi:hydrogenase maturation protein HypF